MNRFVMPLVLVASAAIATSAHAMPVSPVASPASELIAVRNGCGLGWHRGPYGYCRPNGAPYRYAPYAYEVPPPPPVRCYWVDRGHGPRRVCAW